MNTFDTLEQYRDTAKKIISKYNSRSNSKNYLLNNEDIISDVSSAIMYADWKWDSERVGKITGKKKTKYSFRNQCAIWAIKTYLTNKHKKNKLNILDIDLENEKEFVSSYIEDNRHQEPSLNAETNEYHSDIRMLIDEIFNSDLLTEKQKDQIHLYYIEGLTLSAIGDKYNVTREAIRQNIKKGIEFIREVVS
jgi:RNA polymerase sigma factor (sigma-70 family)